MFYQSFKYLLVRTGLTLFLVLVFGYALLFFLHEVALPGVHFNDLWIKWIVVLVCLFFGFVLYGMFGEHRFLRALAGLRQIDLKQVGPEIRNQFQTLVRFTESSYFLPAQGRDLRVDRGAHLHPLGTGDLVPVLDLLGVRTLGCDSTHSSDGR